MSRLHIVIAETMGTDGKFHTEVHPCTSDMEAYSDRYHLIADMAEKMGIDLSTNDADWPTELSGDGWWFRVRDEAFDGFL